MSYLDPNKKYLISIGYNQYLIMHKPYWMAEHYLIKKDILVGS